jgi:23S rRNA (cytosine1962-C5)-methyltransferase
MYPKLILKSGKDTSIFRRHPWIFSGAIKSIEGKVEEGQLVELYDNQGNFLCIGHYQPSSIAVRIITFKNEPIDYAFWKSRIDAAFRVRQALRLTDNPETNVYRLVHGEGDDMPGIIIDIYARVAVTQFHSVGMYLAKDHIIHALQDVLVNRIDGIYDKSEGTMPYKAAVKATNGWLISTPAISGIQTIVPVLEYGNKFNIDFIGGQKTGFFIDQRENRRLVQEYSKGRSVLNMFCYTGGFSVYALRGDASLVHSVDSSKPAIALTDENVRINFEDKAPHESFAEDAFDFLNNIQDKYDIIILDPPAFAKHNESLNNALQGYKRINQKAIQQIKKGGILFTFSCSQIVTKDIFRKSVFAAAANTGRKVSILHQLTQPADHPVSIYHPEGEYLKGLALYID